MSRRVYICVCVCVSMSVWYNCLSLCLCVCPIVGVISEQYNGLQCLSKCHDSHAEHGSVLYYYWCLLTCVADAVGIAAQH